MKTTRIKIDLDRPDSFPSGCVDLARLDATTEADLKRQQQLDDEDDAKTAAQFALGVRQRLRLTQSEFASRIGIPLETVRNWEQGKRRPTGAAKALLTILHHAPEVALQALAAGR